MKSSCRRGSTSFAVSEFRIKENDGKVMMLTEDSRG